MSRKIKPQVKTESGMEDILIRSSAIADLKTINGEDIRGTGNIEIEGGGLPTQPTFDKTKSYSLKLIPNDDETAWVATWVEDDDVIESAEGKGF